MLFVVWLGVPFLLALAVSAVFCASTRLGALWATLIGVALAFGFVLWAYLGAPTTYDGGETELFLGRYWEPQFVGFLAVGGFVSWLVGVAVGAGISALLWPRSCGMGE